MPQTLPIRDVGAAGVITDVAPASLPPNAFTRAKNVRFDEGAVVRAPVFRSVKAPLDIGLLLGTELVTNGTFTTDVSGWTTVSGAFNKIPSGAQLKENGGPPVPHVYQAITTVIGETYQLTGDIIDGTCDGAVSVSTSTDTSVARIATSPTATGNASVDFTFTATGTTTYVLLESKGTVTYNQHVHFDNISVKQLPSPTPPRFCYGTLPASGYGTVLLLSDTYGIDEYASGVVTDRSGSIAAMASNQAPFTGCTLADITYFNRNDRVPAYRANGGTDFADLPHWDTGWRAESLRSYGDFLIALNVKEGSTTYPTRVRWSNLASANSVPNSWDASDTTESAGFNDLMQMKTGIVDGAALGSNFIIYSKDQVWLMEFVGGTFIFNFRKLFSDAGLINQNCAVEVEGKHFCFDNDDIYTHDGNSQTSIVDGRIKSYIFNSIDTAKLDRCFVHHNPSLDEIYFCYSSGDDLAEFTRGDRCNRAAVFNYQNNTWSFMDLPNVSSATVASVESTTTYQNVTGSYHTLGGTYHSQEAGYSLHTLFVGDASTLDNLTSHKLYGLDGFQDNTLLTFEIDTVATQAPFIERVGIDLDESIPLDGYKFISKVVPQVHTNNSGSKEFQFSFGASDLISGTTTYETTVPFDSTVSHKIDSRSSGRYLSYKMTVADNKDFKYLGFDVDITASGRR